jgi:hypothetical protein
MKRYPYDSWVRHANRLTDELSYCYAREEPFNDVD